jgi:hypothetical protein
VLRQAQHEATLFVAPSNEITLILSLSKDEAAAPAAGNRDRFRRQRLAAEERPSGASW